MRRRPSGRAIDIRAAIQDLNRKRNLTTDRLDVGIGINSGEMVAGNLGSKERMEYTVIGDRVNVASRLTSMAEVNEIWISKATFDLMTDTSPFLTEKKGFVTLKGRKEKIMIFKVVELNEANGPRIR